MEEYVVGSCEEMCPRREKNQREKERRVHQLEIEPKTNVKCLVKEFHRSAAGCRLEQSDIRTPKVLKDTLHHLIKTVLKRDDIALNIVYDFIFDRLRALRQDLTVQNYTGPESLYILEAAVRFYLYAAQRLHEEPPDKFDAHINFSHLQACLKQILRMYEDIQDGQNYSEMISLYLLLHAGSYESLAFVVNLPKRIKLENNVTRALMFSLNLSSRNYVRVIRIFKELTFLEKCAAKIHLPQIQRQILAIMSVAYNKQSCTLDFLTKLLYLPTEKETTTICQYYGIEILGEKVIFSKAKFNSEKKIYSQANEDLIKKYLTEKTAEDVILGVCY